MTGKGRSGRNHREYAGESMGLENSRGKENFRIEFCLPDGSRVIREFQRPARLILLGGGYVAQALCRLAVRLEFSVSVVDDRAEFANEACFPDAGEILCCGFEEGIRRLAPGRQDYVAVLTRGHRWDADCLRTLFKGERPFYLGMIGSRRRVRLLFEQLEQEGCSREILENIHAPIGLDIGAVTVDEIAVSILAELIQCRNTGNHQEENVLDQKNIDPVFLKQFASGERQMLAVVVERTGSAPVKTGAIMAVNEQGKTFGTIGGGCGEYQVLQQALEYLREGRDGLISVDLSNANAEEEGMVCGGQMKVFLKFQERKTGDRSL